MKNHYLFYFLSFIYLSSQCQTKIKNDSIAPINHKYTNKLIDESSPYLLQHAHNPVNWYPWGKEALDKAKNENKLIIISIGYSACHWCHVMEHETFENEDVAKFMNDNFVSIKVDREERPDIDQIYMHAIQILSGNSGWPLNCIALPDGRPFYGGTYFSKEKWMEMLKYVADYAKNNPDKIEIQAAKLQKGVQDNDMSKVIDNKDFNSDDIKLAYSNLITTIDFEKGGSIGTPKFPLPVNFDFLLQYSYLFKNDVALKAVTTTLDKMSNGGIYDQIGGGFARYSTDESWKIPHFEKMLYDNAQLVSLYSNAFKVTKNPKYKKIVVETLDFIQRELTSSDGGFYSSLDADSEGEEGKYYAWTRSELAEILDPRKSELFFNYYNISKKGNWENGKNILYVSDNNNKLMTKFKIGKLELEKSISEAKKLVLNKRNTRIKPNLDDKILTSWNALTIKAYVDAYSITNDEKYLAAATKNAEFIIDKLKSKSNRLNRNYKNEKASINGFLDDYAFTIEAFIALYQATLDEKWLIKSRQLMTYSIEHFYNLSAGMFYYTSNIDMKLITRKYDLADNVLPASNSVMAKNLFKLGNLFSNDSYLYMSKTMLKNVKSNSIEKTPFYSNWASLMALTIKEPYEIVVIGDDYLSKLKFFNGKYLPNIILSGGKNEGILEFHKNKRRNDHTMIYVCFRKTCKLPVTDENQAMLQIKR